MIALNFLNNFQNLTIGLFLSWFIVFPISGENINSPQQLSTTINISEGGGGRQNSTVSSMNNLTNEQFFRKMLEKHFPDWEARINFEKEQGRIYHRAEKKLKEYQKLFPMLNNGEELLTREEILARDYFKGRGIYAKYQDPTTPPNLFDTRKTLLKKMENEKMRQKFLESYNRLNPIDEN